MGDIEELIDLVLAGQAVKVKSFGTGPVRTQSVVDRVPLLQHVQSPALFLDAIWLTQMAALVALR